MLQEQQVDDFPYQVNYKNELPYFLATAALYTSGIILIETNKAPPFTISELANLNPNEINSFDRGAINKNSSSARSLSDVLFQSSFLLPHAIGLTHGKLRRSFGSYFILTAEAFLISGALNVNVKHLVNRSRPYVYNPSFSLETRTSSSSRLSFYSGHTALTATSTFFVAKVLSDVYPDMNNSLKAGLWAAAVFIPAYTGYLRIESGRHYNTDVIVGYALGAAIGYFIPQKHKKDRKLLLNPTMSQLGTGLSLRFSLG